MALLESRLSPKVQIRNSDIAGKGIYALEQIFEADVIVEWGGTYVTKVLADKAKADGRLVIQWDEDLYSIEDRGLDDGYFINHSCSPNSWMSGAFKLVAIRDIQVGEELTADYAMWEANPEYLSKWECGCGSTNCRKRITGHDWEKNELQDKYKDHFSPLINKLIKRKQLQGRLR